RSRRARPRRRRAPTSCAFRPRWRRSSSSPCRTARCGLRSDRRRGPSRRAEARSRAAPSSGPNVVDHPIRALVSLDEGIEETAVRAALPVDAAIQVVGVLRGVEESWTTLRDTQTDLLVLACSGYSERALSLIGGTAREHPDLPIVVLSQSSPDGFLSRLFEVRADDVIR